MRTAANNAQTDRIPWRADGQAMTDYMRRYGLEADWQGWLTKAGERVAYKIDDSKVPGQPGFLVVWIDPAKREMVLNPTTRAAKVTAAGTKGSASFTLTCEGVGDDGQNTMAGVYLAQDGFREFVADYIKHLVDSAKFWQYDEDVTDPAGADGHMHIDSVVMDYDNLTIEADFSAKIQGTVTYDYAINSEFDADDVRWAVGSALTKSIEHQIPGGDLMMDRNPVSAKRIEKTAEGWLAQAREMTATAVRYKKMSPGAFYRKIWTGDEVSSVYLGGNWGLGLKGELLIAKNDPDKPSDEQWGWYVAQDPQDIKYVTEQVEKYKSNGWDIPTKYQGLYDQASRVTASFQMTKIGAKDYPQEAVERAIRRLEWSDIPKEGKAELPFMQGEALNQIIKSLKLPRPSRVALHGGIGDGHGFYGAEFNMKKEDLTLYIADTGTETFIVAYDQRPKGAEATAGKVEFLEVGDTVRFTYPGHTFEGKVGEITDSDFKRTGVGVETVYLVEGEGIDPEDADSWATADELERVTAQKATAAATQRVKAWTEKDDLPENIRGKVTFIGKGYEIKKQKGTEEPTYVVTFAANEVAGDNDTEKTYDIGLRSENEVKIFKDLLKKNMVATAKSKPADEPTDETYAVYGDSEFYRTGDHFYFSNEGRLVELNDDQADQLRAFLAKNTDVFKSEKERVDALRKMLTDDLGLIKRKMMELEMIAVKARLQKSHGDKVEDLTRKVLSLTRAVKSAYAGPVAVAIHPLADQIGVKARQVYNETHTDNWVTAAIDPMSRDPKIIRAKIDEIDRDVRDLKLPIGLANVMANRLKDGLRELKKAIDNL